MLWLIGTGPMARDYAAVLRHLDVPWLAVGRDAEKTAAFAGHWGVEAVGGGVDEALRRLASGQLQAPMQAIVATPVDTLAEITRALLPVCGRVLVEKPGALEAAEMRAVADAAEDGRGRARVVVAYNRRFLASVEALRARLRTDGPVLSAIVEFDEPIPRIEALATPAAIKARWGYANAAHVFDLLGHLCGEITHVAPLAPEPRDPVLAWHPAGAVYVGAGRTMAGTRFVYHGNYASVGRWRLTLSVAKRRYLLMPLEALQCVEGASVMPVDVPLPDVDPAGLKPGLTGQVRAFLAPDVDLRLASAAENARLLATLATLFGYPS
jgi:predicted dehydrogenase